MEDVVYFDDANGDEIEITRSEIAAEMSVERLNMMIELLKDEAEDMAIEVNTQREAGLTNHKLVTRLAAFRKGIRWINKRLGAMSGEKVGQTLLKKLENQAKTITHLMAQNAALKARMQDCPRCGK